MERKKRRMVNNLTMSPRPVTEPTMVELKPLKITAEEGADKIKPKNTGRTINLDCQSHKNYEAWKGSTLPRNKIETLKNRHSPVLPS